MTLILTKFSNILNIYELFFKLLQNTADVITIYNSSDYYKSRQQVITIYDMYVITNHDNYYYNLRQVLQFTTTVITIHGITIHDVITIHDSTSVTKSHSGGDHRVITTIPCCQVSKANVATELIG